MVQLQMLIHFSFVCTTDKNILQACNLSCRYGDTTLGGMRYQEECMAGVTFVHCQRTVCPIAKMLVKMKHFLRDDMRQKQETSHLKLEVKPVSKTVKLQSQEAKAKKKEKQK
jgi:hypothetical protein